MAVEEVGARLSLKDKAPFSRGIRDAAQDVERLGDKADRTGTQMSSLGRLASGARGAVGLVGSAARGAAVGVGILTGAAVAGGIALVNLTSDAAEVESKFNTVFGPQGTAQVGDWIGRIQDDVHIATDELRNAASTFGVFGQAVGVPAGELAKFSTDLAQAGLDLSSFANASPEDTFLALRSGLAGESEPLRQFGIFLSDASLNAFAAAEGIGKTTAEMTEQEKVLLRQQFILANLGAAQGDLERTATGVANQERGLTGAFRDFRVELGEGLMPVAETLLPVLTDGLGEAIDHLRANMPDVQARTRDWAVGLRTLYRTIRNGRVDTSGFDRQIEEVFGSRLGGVLNDSIDLVSTLRTNIGELGTESGTLATVSEMFGPDAADTLEAIFEAGENVGVIFRDTLVPAWQGAQETLGPLAGSSLKLLAEGLEWAADNAERLAPFVEAIFVTYITSSAVNTVFRAAAGLRALAGAMGLASVAAGTGTGAAATGLAGGLARVLPLASALITVLRRLDDHTANWEAMTTGGVRGFFEGAINTGLATAEGLTLGAVPAIGDLFGVDLSPDLSVDLTSGQTATSSPDHGGAWLTTPTGVPTSRPGASTHDSWRAAPVRIGLTDDSGARTLIESISIAPQFNIRSTVDPEGLRRVIRDAGPMLVEEVQRGIDRRIAR